MTYQELVAEIEKLPLDDQLSLLQALTDLIGRKQPRASQTGDSLKRVRGLLKPSPGETLPAENELANGYTDYLVKKYS